MVLLGEEHSYFFFGIYLSHTSEIFMFSVKRKKKLYHNTHIYYYEYDYINLSYQCLFSLK